MSEETMEQIGIMVAYMAAREGGNDRLAQEIANQAEKKGITIKLLETEEVELD